MAQVGGGQHGHLRAFTQELARHGAHAQRDERQRCPRRGRVADDPLTILGVEEEGDASQCRLQQVALLEEVLLFARRRHPQEEVLRQLGRPQRLQRPADLRQPGLQPGHVLGQDGSILVGQCQPRQWVAEPRTHLLEREPRGEDAHQLRLEVVRLVDHQQAPLAELLGVPVAQRREIRRVRAEDRCLQRGLLGADVGAAAGRAPHPPTQPARGRYRGARIPLAQVVVTAFHQRQVRAELALVLILKVPLRGQQVGVPAPPGERHGDVALADARRGLDQQDTGSLPVLLDLGQRVGEPGQEPRLLRPRREAVGKVREEVGHPLDDSRQRRTAYDGTHAGPAFEPQA